MRSVRESEPVLICPALVADRQVGNEGIFGFARAMRDNRRATGALSQLDAVKCFCQGADLIDFDQNRIRHARGRFLCAGTLCW